MSQPTPSLYWLRQQQSWLRHQNYVEIKASYIEYLYEELPVISVGISSNELEGSGAKVLGDIISGIIACSLN